MKIRNFRPPFGVNRSASDRRKSRGHFAPESDRRRALPAAYRARPVWLLHVFFLLFRLFLRERLELLGRRPGGRFCSSLPPARPGPATPERLPVPRFGVCVSPALRSPCPLSAYHLKFGGISCVQQEEEANTSRKVQRIH